jgi:hypothetical protein
MQLANACFAGGYDEVFPATWGDELIAAGCLEQLESRTGPAIFCACPLVAEQLRGAVELRRFIVPLISPPVAVARYLRARNPGDALRITYVGDCPGAYDEAIDVRLSPHELLSILSRRKIFPATQRTHLGARAENDRRRFYSLPGGVPAPQWLAAQWPKRALVDVHAGDALAGLANQTLSRGNTLIDFAPQLGCACAGAVGGADAEHAREAVLALEPPRSQSEIVEAAVRIEVSLAPAGEHHDADLTWGDFLAALPAALSMHPEDSRTPVVRQTSRTAPRRALQKNSTLPRAYMAARAGARRDRGASPRAASAQPVASSHLAQRDTASGESHEGVLVARADAHGTRHEEISAARPNPWLARRASHEGMTGPRGGSSLRSGLAPADRWLLSGLMLAGSVLVAVLTSALTVRGMEHSPSAATSEVTLPAQPVTNVAAAPMPPAHDSSSTIRATHSEDSASIALVVRHDSAPNRHASGGALARPSPMPPKRVVARAERLPVSIADHGRATPLSAIVSPSSIATRTSASTPPATIAPSTTAPSITAPAPVASPLANPAVLEELRAIHAEIDARKRHMDSLTSALDSLNHVPKPD